MNKTDDYFKRLQKRIAGIAIGSSSFRNPGAPGVVGIGRLYCTGIDLQQLTKSLQKGDYKSYLDAHTLGLERKIKGHLKKSRKTPNTNCWGLARKGLNIFFRDVYDNRYMAERYYLKESYKSQLEVPLDLHTARRIIDHSAELYSQKLKWDGVKNLNKENSKKFQEAASLIAKQKGIFIVELDVFFWRDVKP